MSKNRTTSDLLLELDGRHERSRRERLLGALRDGIRSGRLDAGAALPSTRSLAADLGLSRGLVVDAYDQLVAEGYLVSRQGSGTRVADGIGGRVSRPPPPSPPSSPSGRGWRVDFEPGNPDLAAFPRSRWASAIRAAAAELTDAELAYRDAEGDEALRIELADYLGRVRGADCRAEDVRIVGGFTNGLGLLGRALWADGNTTVAVEDPGPYVQRDNLRAAGAGITPVRVDTEGVLVDRLSGSGADVVIVTPAHQYPTGAVLSPARRAELIDWAVASPGRLIVEDDYDAEFRYDRSPIGSVQGLAPDRVVMGGSVSKSLLPSLGIGWLVVPPGLAEPVTDRIRTEHLRPSIFDQRALARLLSTGRYDRHIRTMRAAYQAKRDLLLEALAAIDGIEVAGVSAGLQVLVWLPDGVDVGAVVARAAADGVRIPDLARYRVATDDPSHPARPGVVIGYAHLTSAQIADGVDVIGAVLATDVTG
ncbi:MAG: PLP-dependent aminotransferase family protein [Actinomycetota bacterium]